MIPTVSELRGRLGRSLVELSTSPEGWTRRILCVTYASRTDHCSELIPGELLIVDGPDDESVISRIGGIAQRSAWPGPAAILCSEKHIPPATLGLLPGVPAVSNVPIGLLRRDVDPLELANDLNRWLVSLRGRAATTQLARAETLQGLAECLGRLVENSVTIETPSHELLANSPAGSDVDRDRVETILHRRAAARIMEHEDFRRFFSRVKGSDRPLHLEAHLDLGFSGRVAMRIAEDGELLGVIWVTDTARPLLEADYETIREAAVVAAGIISRERVGTRREALLKAEVLDEVVTGKIVDPENIRVIGLSIGWNVDRLQQVMVVAIDDFEEFRLRHSRGSPIHVNRVQDRLLDLVKLEAQALDPQAVLAMRGDSIIILAGRQSERSDERKAATLRLGESIVRKASVFLPDIAVTVGAGRESEGLAHLKDGFRQARLAVELGQSLWGGRRVVHYDDLGIHRVLFALRQDEGMIPPSLQRLESYDRDHNTDYVTTLRAYLNHMGRLRSAAEELHVHRNTLEYRIGRIAEVADISFDDPDSRLALELGLRLLDLGPVGSEEMH